MNDIPRSSRPIRRALLVAALAATVGLARAQDNAFTWQDGYFWDLPDGSVDLLNWSNNPLGLGAFQIGADPFFGFDHTEIRAGSFTGTTLTSAVGLTLSGGSLTLTSGPSAIGGDLVVSGGALAAGGLNVAGAFDLSAGSVLASLTVGGAFRWSGGALGGSANVAAADLGTADGQVLTNAGLFTLGDAATWNAYGTDLENWGGTIQVARNASLTFTNTGIESGAAANGIGLGTGIVGGTLINDGSLAIAATNFPDPSAGVFLELNQFTNHNSIDVTASGQNVDIYGADGFENTGSILVGSGDRVGIGSGAPTLPNDGTISVEGTGSYLTLYDYGGEIVNHGHLEAHGMGSTIDAGYLTNHGTIAASDGASISGYNVKNDGDIETGSGGDFWSNGDLTNSGTIQVAAGGRFEVWGNVANAGQIVVSGGDLTFEGNLDNSGSLKVDGGGSAILEQIVGNTGTISVTGAGSVVHYRGDFSEASLPSIFATRGGKVSLEGYLQNQGSTYDPTVPLSLPSGFEIGTRYGIQGGNVANSSQLFASGASWIFLNGVALDGGLDLSAGGLEADLNGGTTFGPNPTIRLGSVGASGSSYVVLAQSAPQTLVGATLVFGSGGAQSGLLSPYGDDLTLDKGATATGGVNVTGAYEGVGTFTNQGTIAASHSGPAWIYGIQGFHNIVNQGTITATGDANSVFYLSTDVLDNQASGTIDAHGGLLGITRDTDFTNEGLLEATDGGRLHYLPDFTNSGTVLVDVASSAILTAGYEQAGAAARTQIDGTMTLNGTLTLGTGASGDGGELGGGGKIDGSVVNLSGTVAPGDPKVLTITGDYTQGALGLLAFDIAGDGGAGALDGFDRIAVGGNLTLDGTLDLTVSPAYSGGAIDLFTYGGALTFTHAVTVVDLSDPSRQFALVAGPGGTVRLQSVPEPGVWAAISMGLAGLARRRGARRSRT